MYYVVETFRNPGEPSSAPLRVRPCLGQGLSLTIRVECSRSMREAHPAGQKFLIKVQWKRRDGAPDWLYCNYRDEWQPLTDLEADRIIRTQFGSLT